MSSVLALALVLLAQAGDARVYVETSSLSAPLIALLASDLSEGTVTSSAVEARLFVSVVQVAQAIELVGRDANGAVVVERRIDASEGVTPALRTAALLVREALDDLELAEPEPVVEPPVEPVADPVTEPIAEPAVLTPRVFEAGVVLVASGWKNPSAPLPGMGVGLHARYRVLDALRAGLHVSISGCCKRESREATGTLRELFIFAGVDWEPLELSIFHFGASAGAGVDLVFGDAAGNIFAAPGTTSSVVEPLPMFVLAGLARTDLSDRWSLRLTAGARVLGARYTTELPDAFQPQDPDPLDTGFVSYFATLGLGFAIF